MRPISRSRSRERGCQSSDATTDDQKRNSGRPSQLSLQAKICAQQILMLKTQSRPFLIRARRNVREAAPIFPCPVVAFSRFALAQPRFYFFYLPGSKENCLAHTARFPFQF